LDSKTKKLFTFNSSYLFTLNVYSDCYYFWCKFIKDEFSLNLTKDTEHEFNHCFELQKESGIYSCIFSELVAIVCKYPKKVRQQPQTFNLHNTDGQAVEWGTLTGITFDCHYINGRYLSKDLFDKTTQKTLKFEEFQKITNEDDKATIISLIKEREGNNGLLNFLGAVLVDEQIIKHTNNYSETQRLYKTKERFSWANDSQGNQNVQLAWNEMICPSTGSTYLIETCPTFNNVIDSAKWLRPKSVPLNLIYQWQSAN
jgi:hypothetical protein